MDENVQAEKRRPYRDRREYQPREMTERPVKKKAEKKKVVVPAMKLFGRWDSVGEVHDIGLRTYINLTPRLLPRSAGSLRRPFHKSKMHIVERLALHMLVPGHQGGRHRITSGIFGGAVQQNLATIEKAFTIIENSEKKNPVEILVRAIENAALREEVTSYQMGSIVARDAVITAPQRRVDRTLRFIAQGTYRKSFHTKKKVEQALAEELINAARGSNESHAVKEKERVEREATGSR